jgi:formylglycine-generating enzyme required for sulfatase activity
VSSRKRIAFIFSSNGPDDLNPLKYAAEDADRIARSLSSPKCGFRVVRPTSGSDPFDLRRQLFTVTESCNPEDLLICYFSGHGILEKGSLFLLWDGTDINRPISTAIPVSDVLQALQYCKANSKLLILDCCHAGAAAGKIGVKSAAATLISDTNLYAENHLVLMASGRVEQARELEELQGSFLTVKICDALDEMLYDADVDQDGRLSVNDLSRWLERQAREHNNQFPDRKVPIPYLFGQQKGEFFLTWEDADWQPYEFPSADGSIMVILPRFATKWYGDADRVLCISKYPVTNKQYRKFVDHLHSLGTSGRNFEPTGKSFAERSWTGPFYPWQDEHFNLPDQPVVCVTYYAALDYCRWADSMNKTITSSADAYAESWQSRSLEMRLATPSEWDFAAYGSDYHGRHPRSWLSRALSIHHMASGPAPIDVTGARSNAWGLSDMFGNVWEWCLRPEEGDDTSTPGLVVYIGYEHRHYTELRGGSFLDDLRRVEPEINSARLQDGLHTSHSDLGFRIAGTVSFQSLPGDVRERLSPWRHIPVREFLDAELRDVGPKRSRHDEADMLDNYRAWYDDDDL